MIRCPRCKKEVSELDEKCKYCGLVFDEYKPEETEQDSNGNEESNYSYVAGYNLFLWIFATLIFVGGIIIGQEETSLMLICWIVGIIFLVIVNMLKNVVQELRILNSKIK